MNKRIFTIIGLIGLSSILISWGGAGHYKINQAAGLSFNSEMDQFNAWVSILASHASDADYRKSDDPTEGHKHYIDIDNYSEFLAEGKIAQSMEEVIAIHGASFVDNNGILPWATLATFDSLENCFRRRDWDKAVLFAADLGHYVGDGHMPLHLTRNYDGQYTGNSGIHSRYESTMINAYISQFIYDGKETIEIQDVNQYIFDYIYESYTTVESVIDADDYAKSVNSSTSSTEYKQALWSATKGFTIPLFSNASHALSELIYTAWVHAGSPLIYTNYVHTLEGVSTFKLENISPNPIKTSAQIKFQLTKNCDVQLQVLNSNGQLISTLVEGQKERGDYNFEWKPAQLPSGIYFIILKSGEFADIKRVVVVN